METGTGRLHQPYRLRLDAVKLQLGVPGSFNFSAHFLHRALGLMQLKHLVAGVLAPYLLCDFFPTLLLPLLDHGEWQSMDRLGYRASTDNAT